MIAGIVALGVDQRDKVEQLAPGLRELTTRRLRAAVTGEAGFMGWAWLHGVRSAVAALRMSADTPSSPRRGDARGSLAERRGRPGSAACRPRASRASLLRAAQLDGAYL